MSRGAGAEDCSSRDMGGAALAFSWEWVRGLYVGS